MALNGKKNISGNWPLKGRQ